MIIPESPRPGDLLVASVGTGDDYFSQSVVLLLDADGGGALGVTLNRTSTTPMEDVLPGWVDLASPPQVLFSGGPISPNGAVCLARLTNPHEDPPGWRRVFEDVGLLHLDTPVELAQGAYSDLRIFAGYCGWDAGQLEGELLRGDWYVTRAREDEVFGADQTGLWRRILRRQPGVLSFLSTWLGDPEQN